ncbi:hypothetical protein LAG90_18900 [Marinilongibacter aquaticus]|uniref:hypothetical protein n=1 Tax=Marinilongibacter aquaticus TaxID=2975157 RepID=UPI0021BDA55B|nr:hypothetical protein [Marinilongibacter aquaticus]UBM58869.1 hypothetical protein LAG90_18900 [Marinilongibacter aquaticus]
MKKFWILSVSMAFLWACGPNENKVEIEKLDKSLMEGHDKVMPVSLRLPKMKAEVLQTVEGLEEGDSLKMVAVLIGDELMAASDSMDVWMRRYADARADESFDVEKLNVYKTLKAQIEEVDADTKKAVEKAKTFLENAKN